MRLAESYHRIHGAGAEVVAISVDDEVRQVGMARRWGLTHIRMVADPGGDRYLKPLGLFDPDERGGIALPAMVVIAPDGAEVYRYQGRDFADRTNDDDLLAALDALALAPVEVAPWEPAVDVPDDLRGYFRPADLGAYFRGNMFGAIAIAGRLSALEGTAATEGRAVADEHRLMARNTLDAWDRHKERLGL